MRALVAILLALPAVAFGDWHAGPVVPGMQPLDVQAYDGGLFTVTIGGASTNNGNAFAFKWTDGGATFVDGVDGGDFAGAAMRSATCIQALQATSGLNTSLLAFNGPACGGGTVAMSQGANGSFWFGNRLRASRVGMLVATYDDGSFIRVDTSAGGANWQSRNSGAGAPVNYALSAVPWNGIDFFVYSSNTTMPYNQIDGGPNAPGTIARPSGDPRDLSLFDNGLTVGGFGIDSTGTSLWYSADVKGAGFTVLTTGTGLSAVDYTQLNGSPNGLGFGLLAEGGTILGPVPNPAAPGNVWVPRNAPTGLVAPVIHVSCADPSFCVLLDNAKNVFVYTNDGPPSFGAIGPLVIVPPNQSNPLPPVSVTDPDGDPIWVTADGGSLAGFALQFDGGTSANVTFTSGTGCANPGTPITLVASDGWKAHDTSLTFNVAWDQLPPVPQQAYVRAGGTPVDAAIVPTCPGEAYAYSYSGDAGVTVSLAGLVTPPVNICSPLTVNIAASALSVDGGQLVYSVPVTVEPYGPPLDPSFGASNATQLAGSTRTYDAGPDHVCGPDAGTIGFVNASTNPFGASVTFDAGPFDVTVISTDPCIDSSDGGGDLVLRYQRTVNNPLTAFSGDPVQVSDAGTLTISFVPNPGPIDATVSYSFTVTSAASGLVSGDCGNPTGALCPASRNYLNDVTITQGANTIADGGFPLGPWALAVPSSCSGMYLVNSTLTDLRFGGSVSAPSVPVQLTATSKPEIAGLTGTLTLSCSGGGGEVTAVIDGGCGQALSWQALGAFTLDAGSGNTASIHYQAGNFDALAGTVANVQITIADGTSSPVSKAEVALIEPDHFITLQRNPNPVIPSEEEASGVELLLHNTSGCDVSGVGVREQLRGLTVVDGSVRVNNRKADARVEGGLLSIDGLSLPAGGTAHVTYLARVPLLTKANPQGSVVMVRPKPDSRVSCSLTSGGACQFDVTAPVGSSGFPRSCGCGAVPDASVLLLTLAGFLLRRRPR